LLWIFIIDGDSQAGNIATDCGGTGAPTGENGLLELQPGRVAAICFLKKEMPAPARSSTDNIQEEMDFFSAFTNSLYQGDD